MLTMLRLGAGVSTLVIMAAAIPAGKPMAPASTLGRLHTPASARRIAIAAAVSPVSMPTMAPQALVRFHQTDSTSTGKAADALKLSDHRNNLSGSSGAATASHAVMSAIPTSVTRAD